MIASRIHTLAICLFMSVASTSTASAVVWPQSDSPSGESVDHDDLEKDLATQSDKGIGPGEVLYDSIQFHVGGATSVSSQRFLGTVLPDGTFESRGADDFVVDGYGWTIDRVEVKGHYFGGVGAADSVNVYVLADSGGLPSTTDIPGGALASFQELPFLDNMPNIGDLVIDLPSAISLPPATYWLIVQVNMAAPDQWGWTTIETSPGSGEFVGYPGAWMQNAAGIAADCVGSWGAIATCGIASEPDYGFILRGTRASTPAVAVPALNKVSILFLAVLLGLAGPVLLRR